MNRDKELGDLRESAALLYYKGVYSKKGYKVRLATVAEDALGYDIIVESKQAFIKGIQVKGQAAFPTLYKLMDRLENDKITFEIFVSYAELDNIKTLSKFRIFTKKKGA